MSKAISSLAVGDKIEVPVLSAYQSRFGAKIIFKVADKNHSGYPSNSVTLITEKIIQLMCSDAKEASNSNSDRRNYGNNRHIHSNILQWLNSNATAGNWYSAKHSADAPPTNANVWDNYNEYDAWAGFLAMLDPKFVAELLDTTLTVAKSSTDGGSYETFTAKMFLASTTEVGLANENGIAEGALLALFSNDASRIAYPTAECVSNSEYSNSNFTTSKGWYWWLRTPYSSYAYVVRYVSSDGTLNLDYAYYGNYGVRPLCNLQSSILVSDSPNASGNYEIIYNAAPSAPPSITAPDTAYSGQNINISCAEATDPDGDALTYVFERSANSGAWTQVQSSAALLAMFFKAQIVQDRAAGTEAITDEMILQSAEVIDYPEYEDAHAYNTVGEIIKYNGRYYEIIAPHTSNAVSYPVETTFAYYRLVELTHTGTIDDPIPYPETAGIVVNVENGKYYSYKGKTYLAKADMPNCVYPPDTPSLWQWEEVNSGEG